MDPSIIRRLRQASRVCESGCWPSLANTRAVININGRCEYASRVACRLKHGAPPAKDSVARHKCRTQTCMNPDHLEWGTWSQNNGEDRERDSTQIQGQAHHRATITEETARAIKHSRGDSTRRQRAEMFGVSECLVRKIDDGHSWRHIPDKNGAVNQSIRSSEALGRQKAKERIWTPDMFAQAAATMSKKCMPVDHPTQSLPCQVWQGNLDIGGYGYFRAFGKQVRCHVIAKEAQLVCHKPVGKVTRHLCNVRACCNPAHIAFGTLSENANDKKTNGTCFFSSDRNPKRKR